MNGELIFVDTNVLVYAYDVRDPHKRARAAAVLRRLWGNRSGVVSTQVLQEFYVAATRKLRNPLARAEARRVVGAYTSWVIRLTSADDVLSAAELEEAERLSFWDALIVTSAARAGARVIVSEDFQASRIIRGIRIENPFLT